MFSDLDAVGSQQGIELAAGFFVELEDNFDQAIAAFLRADR